MPDEYPNVMLCAVILAAECIIVNYIMVVPARMKHFNPAFMNNFKEEHGACFGDIPPVQGGFPDMGNGWYADKLSYAAWYDLNNSFRV